MTGVVQEPGEPNEGRHRADFATFRRPTSEALALEHEAARMRAKLMDPETALRELAERLTFAHVNAGKPSLAVLSEAVHYSKGTLSKVFAGKMVPSWPLVEGLAAELGVPTQTVIREWFHLWTAANTLRRRPGGVRERAATEPATTAVPAGPPAVTGSGHTCPACGSWVVDPALHAQWHRQAREVGRGGPASGALGGWGAQGGTIGLNRETLGR
ncbi:helix-turn-helix transcriptional regulator [Actinoplanes sp. NPDC048967]|uniref:helix-turn-helix domain-containing protein n=2 Tax=unclassified Actinoplanes TaxID=2626549 RepID=UPI0033DA3EEB